MRDMPARMLRLLSLLQGRREWSGAELAERLGVTGRTVRRDIDRLRELGYPVHGTTGTAGGYRLGSGRDLPPLLLDDEEAVAIAVGLRTAAGGGVAGIEETSVRALAKLEQVLPARLRRRIAALGEATVWVPSRELPRVDPAALAVLAAACRDAELVTFGYRGSGDAELVQAAGRTVEPHSLVTLYGHWYLVGYDTDRAAWRTFRVDRLTEPRPTGRRFAPRPLPDPDAATYLSRTLGTAPYRYRATVTLAAPADVVRARLHAPVPGRIEARGDDCVVRIGSDSLDLVAQQVAAMATLGVRLTVDGPAELLAHLRASGTRLTGAAG